MAPAQLPEYPSGCVRLQESVLTPNYLLRTMKDSDLESKESLGQDQFLIVFEENEAENPLVGSR